MVKKAKMWWDRPNVLARAKKTLAIAFFVGAGLLAAIVAALVFVAYQVATWPK